MGLNNDVHKWLISLFNDPVLKILVKNSNLTEKQLETFIIDVLAENIAEKSLKYEEKAYFRLQRKVSRGAFNRTLKQARKNIIQSIYTTLLLSYLGIFEENILDRYINLGEKLRIYLNAYKNFNEEKEESNKLDLLKTLREELKMDLNLLSEPKKTMKKV